MEQLEKLLDPLCYLMLNHHWYYIDSLNGNYGNNTNDNHKRSALEIFSEAVF